MATGSDCVGPTADQFRLQSVATLDSDGNRGTSSSHLPPPPPPSPSRSSPLCFLVYQKTVLNSSLCSTDLVCNWDRSLTAAKCTADLDNLVRSHSPPPVLPAPLLAHHGVFYDPSISVVNVE